VITAVPKLTPSTWGCVAGVAEPAEMETLGVTVAAEELLESETVTPPAGAGVDKVTGKGTTWLGTTCTLAGSVMAPEAVPPPTVTVAVALTRYGPLAVIVVDPAETPVTSTLIVVTPAAKVALPGTVATLRLLETRLTGRAVDMGPERVRVRVCAAPALMDRLGGEKLNVPLT
jgi:hypothetical protein